MVLKASTLLLVFILCFNLVLLLPVKGENNQDIILNKDSIYLEAMFTSPTNGSTISGKVNFRWTVSTNYEGNILYKISAHSTHLLYEGYDYTSTTIDTKTICDTVCLITFRLSAFAGNITNYDDIEVTVDNNIEISDSDTETETGPPAPPIPTPAFELSTSLIPLIAIGLVINRRRG
ncbi:MAG: hypothetical protein INQ03_22610 [Candidatus Heimdallarchaeota archaeon]|nr:hypothetical protein [Candidatus Heimdallarchaeota archaeon]